MRQLIACGARIDGEWHRKQIGFLVRKTICETCIYGKDSPLDLAKLEDDVRDPYVGFRGYRVCHHSKAACCRGFWNAHKDEFAAGQIAQRLGLVVFEEEMKQEKGEEPC